MWIGVASHQKNFDLGFTKIRDILHSGNTHAGTPDTGPEIRDVPGNTGRLATLVTVMGVTVRGTLYKWRHRNTRFLHKRASCSAKIIGKIAHQFIAIDIT